MAAVIYEVQCLLQIRMESILFPSPVLRKKDDPVYSFISIGVVAIAYCERSICKECGLMNAVISELKKMGLEDKKIRTSYVSIDPVYDYTSTPPLWLILLPTLCRSLQDVGKCERHD